MSTVAISAFANLTIAEQTVHEVFSERKLTVSMIHIVNVTAGAVGVYMYFVPPAGAAEASNAALYNFSIPANDFIELGEGQILKSSVAIIASCSVDNAINIAVSGLEE